MSMHPAQIQKLKDALERLYWGPSRFLAVFHETPDQAIAAMKDRPESFGTLRTYVGPASLAHAKKVVLRLARQLSST